MKYLFYFLVISVLLIACHPPQHSKYLGNVNIDGKILNPRDSIGINDTVKILFTIPDTINYYGALTPLIYADRGGEVHLQFWKVDKTANSSGYTLATTKAVGSIVYTPIGYMINGSVLDFAKVGNKLVGQYNFIPKSKGVYFIDQAYAAYFLANGLDYNLNAYFNYGNINRNHQLLLDSIMIGNPTSHFDLYLQDQANQGLEVYGFKVN